MVEPIAIIGCEEGTSGQIHSWMMKFDVYRVECFINISKEPITIQKNRNSRLFHYPTATNFKDKPLYTTLDWIQLLHSLHINKILITINDKVERHKLIEKAIESGFELINAIHPSVIINEDVVIHKNVIIHSGAIIGYCTEIFDGVIINTGVQLDHHNVIKECVTIDPGVVTAGNVTINPYSQIHTGVIVINKINIGSNSIIGAGTVVINDIPDDVTVVGVPGRIIK